MSRELTEKLLKVFVDTGDLHMGYRELAVISAKEIERLLADEREKVREACDEALSSKKDWAEVKETEAGAVSGGAFERGRKDGLRIAVGTIRQLDLTKDLAPSSGEEKGNG